MSDKEQRQLAQRLHMKQQHLKTYDPSTENGRRNIRRTEQEIEELHRQGDEIFPRYTETHNAVFPERPQ